MYIDQLETGHKDGNIPTVLLGPPPSVLIKCKLYSSQNGRGSSKLIDSDEFSKEKTRLFHVCLPGGYNATYGAALSEASKKPNLRRKTNPQEQHIER